MGSVSRLGRLVRRLRRVVLQDAFLGAVILFSISAPVAANDLFIEQLTTDSAVTITQTGGTGNIIAGPGTASGAAGSLSLTFPAASADDAMVLNGDNLTVDLVQTGSTNTLGVDISGSTNTVAVTQEGDLNESRLFMDGNDNTLALTVTGDSNKTSIDVGQPLTSANETTVSATIAGNSNQLDLQHKPETTPTSGNGSTFTVGITGDTNAVKILNTSAEPSTMAVTVGRSGASASGNTLSIVKGQ